MRKIITLWFNYLLLLALITLGIYSCSNKASKLTVDADYSTVQSEDGVKISYLTKGSGDIAIVFVHGWSCDKSYWKNQIDYFAKDYQVVAIDLAGHGNSGTDRNNYTFNLFGADVAAVVNKLGLKKVFLVGHSMGGPVNFEAYARLGNKVIALIGVDTYHEMTKSYPKKMRDDMLKSLNANFKQSVDHFVRSMFPKNADSKLVNEIAKDMSSAPSKVGISSMENLFNWLDMKVSSKPNQIMRNLNIKAVNADLWHTNVQGNKSLFPKFEVKIMKGYGHFIFLEAPDEFNEKLNEFIEELK